MARPGWPERNRAARSFRQLRRFHHVINSDKVFGTHNEPVSDIDIALVDSLKALDPKPPIREADISSSNRDRFWRSFSKNRRTRAPCAAHRRGMGREPKRQCR